MLNTYLDANTYAYTQGSLEDPWMHVEVNKLSGREIPARQV
jgi:hypothetical protein